MEPRELESIFRTTIFSAVHCSGNSVTHTARCPTHVSLGAEADGEGGQIEARLDRALWTQCGGERGGVLAFSSHHCLQLCAIATPCGVDRAAASVAGAINEHALRHARWACLSPFPRQLPLRV